jgi:CBS domain-containing protein
VLTVSPDRSVADAAREMLFEGVHRVVVVEDGTARVLGVLTTWDVMKSLTAKPDHR